MSLVLSTLTTDELLRHAQAADNPTDLELELVSRLTSTLDEVDRLVAILGKTGDSEQAPG